ncbi:gluconate 2-dehydrogenase subunit 3 family protein [Pseudochryseolinea flava]|uniref:Gluconate 2-dehydrogenase subunit 3 family protein n=2 Tax=Pseudochryseolinea flava TaxID=2059302 RepID=A0A364Y190_9BACT|nr:gluconate 2-dehydrogenase subunit 3 family protein [Pseudochryseolinea flava]
MGGVISAPALAGILKGCTAKPSINWKPAYLSQEQATLISQVSEIIIPKTDTPGAKEVGVPEFIDLMLKDVYSEEDQKRFMDGLKKFDEDANTEYGDPFIELSADDQAAFVKKVHDEAIATEHSENRPAKRPFILMTKELTLLGFFTSKAGATQVLQYEAVPGAYKGCVPLKEAGNGKTWAT